MCLVIFTVVAIVVALTVVFVFIVIVVFVFVIFEINAILAVNVTVFQSMGIIQRNVDFGRRRDEFRSVFRLCGIRY